MSKINFTSEHKNQMMQLANKMLLKNICIKGLAGTEINVYDLFHNTSINSLISINSNLKKEIEKLSNLDEWSMNDYQQKKLNNTKEIQNFINLLIGYKKSIAELENDKNRLKELKAKYQELKESTLTPEARLQALEEDIKAIGNIEEED